MQNIWKCYCLKHLRNFGLLQKKWNGTVLSRCSTSNFKDSSGWTVLDMLESKEMTEQTDWQAKKPSQVACVSEGMKWWSVEELETLTYGHKTNNTTPLIAWRTEALKEKALDDLPWKDEKGPLSIRPTLERFNSNTGETSERQEAHMGFPEHVDTILKWAELRGKSLFSEYSGQGKLMMNSQSFWSNKEIITVINCAKSNCTQLFHLLQLIGQH